MDKITELRKKRAQLVTEARTVLDSAESEKRDMSQAENEQYDAIMADVDKSGLDIQREERMIAAEVEARKNNPALPPTEPPKGEPENRTDPRETSEYRSAFVKYMRGGRGNVNETEYRAMQADSDATGGFLVAPQTFVNELIKRVDNEVYIRQLATVFQLPKSESMGVPTLRSNPDDADWTSELQTGKQDTGMTFGKRELRPHPLGKKELVSNKLLRVSTMDIEALVRDRLAYKFGITHEKAFMTGSGSEQPLGLFTPSHDGISTDRDVATGNKQTSLTTDGLIEAKFTLKPQYWKKSQWGFHRETVKMIRKLKDGEGNYIWNAGIKTGAPDTILDLPYFMSEYAPNTYTTGKYVGIIGDFSYYWIADAIDMQIQRLTELYAETNQVGFIARLETDGAPVLEQAFVRVTLA